MAELQIRRLGYALGAEVRGVDLTRSLDDAGIAEIRKVWLDHLVLCFPNQVLSKAQFLAFAGRFGEIDDHQHSKDRDPDDSRMILLTNKPVGGKPWDGYKSGQTWHSDRSHSDRPNPASFLLAQEIPEVGGDTLFANQYMAYEALTPAMSAIVDRLSSVHDAGDRPGVKQLTRERQEKQQLNYPPVVHPTVKIHPETQRKALYVGRVRNFVGMTKEESAPLLDFLNRHATSYEFSYRHRWAVNDLVMWDNRCLLHRALSDYDQQRQTRHMWRISLYGPQVGQPYDQDAGSNSGETARIALTTA
jgi:taurine dioxygenase